MDVCISFYSTHMANYIVKWWRNKFFNGYKHFSDCSDVKISDTEELLGTDYNECEKQKYHDKISIDNVQQEERETTSTSKKILEEILCNIFMTKTKDETSPDEQKFSFTLYDFDKIAKDDIASLVTKIYEAVEAPHCGNKTTIRIKLTVSPDKTSDIDKYKKDLNVIIRQEHRCKFSKRNENCCQQNRNNRDIIADKNDEIVSDEFSDVSSDGTSSDHCSDSDNFHGAKRKKFKKRKFDNNDIRAKKKSASQKCELEGIVQANMEKKTSFQTNRKSSLYRDKIHSRKNESTKNAFHRYLANIVEPSHFYVDLASTSQFSNTDKLLDAVIDVSKKNDQGKRIKKNIERMNNFRTSDIKKNNDYQTKKAHTATGHTSSPHYLKHRNRQEDQARAMAQVVRWLEREFSTNLTIKEKLEKVKHINETENGAKHEHHHVHEHIHHHYHHLNT